MASRGLNPRRGSPTLSGSFFVCAGYVAKKTTKGEYKEYRPWWFIGIVSPIATSHTILPDDNTLYNRHKHRVTLLNVEGIVP